MIRFRRSPEAEPGDYRVERDGVLLGYVARVRVSTDSRIAGTRLIRRGKGRWEWRAIAPGARPICQELQGNFGGGWRLERCGQNFWTRGEAAAALVDWAGR